MEKTKRIILTNWVHLPVLCVVSYFAIIFFVLTDVEDEMILFDAVVSNIIDIPKLFLTDDLPIMLVLAAFFTVADYVGFNMLKVQVKNILAAEWLLLFFPIAYALPGFNTLWWTMVFSLLLSQRIRMKKIKQILL